MAVRSGDGTAFGASIGHGVGIQLGSLISFDEWQNPVYPDDRFMTQDEISARARSAAMIRAQSPGERLCQMDAYQLSPSPTQDPTPHLKSHTTQQYMDWRYNHVVGPQDVWTPWILGDQWAQGYRAPPPPPPAPRPPQGWISVAQVNPRGIPVMNARSTAWVGNSFTTLLGPSRFPLVKQFGLGTAIRVTFTGQCFIQHVYIGPVDPDIPTMAEIFYPLKFGGQTFISLPAVINQAVSDPFTTPLDVSNGLIISGYVSATSGGSQYLLARNSEADWYSAIKKGDHASDLDKSTKAGWKRTGVSVLSVMVIEAYYPPPPPP